MPGESAPPPGRPGRFAAQRPQRGPDTPADRDPIDSTIAVALIALAVFSIPLIVYLKVEEVPPSHREYWPSPVVFDFFSYYKARVAQWLALLLAVLVGLRALGGRRPAIGRSFVFLFGYVLLTAVSAICSDHKDVSLFGYFERCEGLLTIASYATFAVAAATFVRSAAQINRVLSAWLVCMGVVMVVAQMQFMGLNPFSSVEFIQRLMPDSAAFLAPHLALGPKYWVYSTLSNPNYVAMTMAMVVPICSILFVLDWKGMNSGLLLMLTLLACATLAASGGRGAWLAVAMSLPVALLKVPAMGGRKSILRLAAVLLAGVLVMAACQSSGRIRVPADGEQTQVGSTGLAASSEVGGVSRIHLPVSAATPEPAPPADTSGDFWERAIQKFGAAGSGRGYIWIRSVQMMASAWYLGNGPDTFGIHFDNKDALKKYYPGRDTYIDKPHNTFILIAVNQGLPALVAFIGFVFWQLLGSAGRNGAGADSKDASTLKFALSTGLVAFLVASVFYDSNVCTTIPFWIFLGMLGSVCSTGERDHDRATRRGAVGRQVATSLPRGPGA